MNKFIALGNLTKTPELRYGQSGTAVVRFGLAINEGYGDKKQTSFINCVAFGKTAEAISNYTDKGSKVLIDARVQTGSYDKKDGSGKVYTTDFVVNKIEFLDSKKDNKGEKDFGDPLQDFTPIDDSSDDFLPF